MLATIAARYGFQDPAAWALYWRYFGPHARGLAGYAAGATLVSLLLLPVIALIRYAFDHSIPDGNMLQLAGIGAGIVVVRLLGTITSLGLRRHIVGIIKQAVTQLREDLLEQLYLTSREQLSRADVDRLQTRIVQDTERVDVMSNALLSGVLPALFASIALSAGLLYYSWSLVLASLLMVPAVWFASSLTSRYVSRDVQRFQGAFESFSKGTSFVLRQMDLTRVQACEPEEISRQKAVIGDLRMSGEQMSWSYALHGQVQGMVTGIVGIGLLVLGGIEVTQGTLSFGALIAFYFGAGLLNGQVSTVFRGTADVISGSASLTKLGELLHPASRTPYSGTEPIEFRGRFSLRNASFSYGDAAILRDVNLDILPGAHVALIGANGAGKTTLLNLLLGLTAPEGGEVLADERSYAALDLRALRRQIGVVMQRGGVFHGSILKNLTYGEEAATREAVADAARLAGLSDFLAALPEGHDTLVGESGVTLSGGESQRLAIARALLRRPQALILDEPTNHLDVQAVGQLLAGLRALPQAPTIIIVSHDWRLVEFADEVYSVRGGSVAREPSVSQHMDQRQAHSGRSVVNGS